MTIKTMKEETDTAQGNQTQPTNQPARSSKTLTPSCATKIIRQICRPRMKKWDEEKKMLRYAKVRNAISAPRKNTTPHW